MPPSWQILTLLQLCTIHMFFHTNGHDMQETEVISYGKHFQRLILNILETNHVRALHFDV